MLEQGLEKSAEILQYLNSELMEIESNLESLKRNYLDNINEKEELQGQLKQAELKLVSICLIWYPSNFNG